MKRADLHPHRARVACALACALLAHVPAACAEEPPPPPPPPPVDPARAAFENFLRPIGELRDELPETLSEIDLDGDKKPERVATLCSPPGPTAHAAWVIEAGARRFLVAFDELDGRSSLCRSFDGKRKPVWSKVSRAYLEYRQGHHGGGDQYRVALRDGRPVVIWQRGVNDVRAGDLPETMDWDKRVAAHADPRFPDVNTMESGGPVYAVEWTPNVETAFAALGKPDEPPASVETPPAHEDKVLRAAWHERAAGWRTEAKRIALRAAGLLGPRARLLTVRIEGAKPQNPSWVVAAFEERVRFDAPDVARLRTGTVDTGYENGVIWLCFQQLETERDRLGDRFVAGICESNARGSYLYFDEGR